MLALIGPIGPWGTPVFFTHGLQHSASDQDNVIEPGWRPDKDIGTISRNPLRRVFAFQGLKFQGGIEEQLPLVASICKYLWLQADHDR